MHTPTARINEIFKELAFARSRFGIWRQQADTFGKEAIFAIHANAQAVDLAEEYLKTLAPNPQYISLTPRRLIDIVDQIASKNGQLKVLLFNVDLLLWRFTEAQRTEFWETLHAGLVYRPRSIVLMVAANGVLPRGSAERTWIESGRLDAIDENEEPLREEN